jgi:hypothetical protein
VQACNSEKIISEFNERVEGEMFANLLQSIVKVLQAVVGATVQYTEPELLSLASKLKGNERENPII